MARTLSVLLALAASSLHASPARAAPSAVDEPAPPRLTFSLAYFGEFLFHPGAMGGVEYSLLDRPWGTLFVTGNLGLYVHVRNHVGVFVDSEFGYRHTFGSGYELEALAGLGYLHTFLAAPVYEVDDAGHVDKVVNGGRPHIMPTFSVGTGWRFEHVAPFLRVQAFGEYPFNRHLLMHFALLLGARFGWK